jgi:hypothetical protein
MIREMVGEIVEPSPGEDRSLPPCLPQMVGDQSALTRHSLVRRISLLLMTAAGCMLASTYAPDTMVSPLPEPPRPPLSQAVSDSRSPTHAGSAGRRRDANPWQAALSPPRPRGKCWVRLPLQRHIRRSESLMLLAGPRPRPPPRPVTSTRQPSIRLPEGRRDPDTCEIQHSGAFQNRPSLSSPLHGPTTPRPHPAPHNHALPQRRPGCPLGQCSRLETSKAFCAGGEPAGVEGVNGSGGDDTINLAQQPHAGPSHSPGPQSARRVRNAACSHRGSPRGGWGL